MLTYAAAGGHCVASTARRNVEPGRARAPPPRYSVYLIYWYNSTDTDAEGAAEFSELEQRFKEELERKNAALSERNVALREAEDLRHILMQVYLLF